ncbi:carboxymuconolactone decarboxylase family protein [Halieaceae bacterium IMCC14734]|uniref:Carboxymuconolactone decarboxylase family protein n=1 Tax=Candidatus Litorirhabdus singularis TaxID=2518993 RepID=A0ABT3TKR8_9GAMM|nr:carboxymuconolactone decarboxylase family protein [Candidatus Litorirhabdus singularis]MCX2982898.1 carboxymuconolactone decarboxylase family protein [Candidatus Litorirhabdus singularis]
MARVKIVKPESIEDPAVAGIFEWVTQMEGSVPNHFFVELNFPEFFPAKLGATKILWEAGELEMEEIQHVGIVVSKANGCSYCTAAFCTILNHGLGAAKDYVATVAATGADAVDSPRLMAILDYALKVNSDPAGVEDSQVAALREHGLTDKGIVQLTHVVSDFGSYNRLNLALQTDYDYEDLWRTLASKA